MMGREAKKKHAPVTHLPPSWANELNIFYSRFVNTNFCTERDEVSDSIPQYVPVTLTEHEIASSLACIKPNKAPGPDGLRGRVLKDCTMQLKGVLTKLFQLLLDSCTVPKIWKTSNIVPIPKKPGASELKDFRPISLTSILGKCMERVLSSHMTASISNGLDHLQFAYKQEGRRRCDCNLVQHHNKTFTSSHTLH